MPEVTIYHYNRCSKSRAAMAALEDAGIEPQVRYYQDEPPTKDELLDLIEMAGGDPRPFVRTKEAEAKKLADEDLDDADTVAGFVASYPRVLQRPILVADDRATIARDPETVQAFLAAL